MEPQISCPNCKSQIKLTESLAEPLLLKARREYEARFEAERKDIALQEQKKAQAKVERDLLEKQLQLVDLQELLKARDAKLGEAQKQQAEFLKKQRELEDQKRELDLTIERRTQDNLQAVHQKARAEAEDALRLQVSEKEMQIAGMQKQIDELKRRAEQGSQQIQGEVLEAELESLLASRFPHDVIEPVAKGELGADILHRVVGVGGQTCGTIIWETKRTKNWNEGWLGKLREDQRAAGAEIAILVSSALPKGMETLDLVDGIYITHPRATVPLAVIMRQSILELATARAGQDNKAGKMEQMYEYLTGPRFRHRVEAIVEKFTDMQEDLAKERRVMTKQWVKREKQIEVVIEATTGLYGDLQGIAGKAMPVIEALELGALEHAGEDGLEPDDG
jgi:hypothetical protein